MMNRSRPFNIIFNIIFEIKASMSTNSKIQNHYEVLNISQTSTQDDIKSAYYELTKKYHPDKNTSKDAKTKFQKVSAAYEVLGNFTKRKQYDRDLMARGHKATVTSHPASASVSTAASYGIRRTMEADPLAAFYRSKLGNNPGTPIYNFDDWTRAHYGRTLKKSIEEKEEQILRKKLRLEEFEEDLQQNKSALKFILICSTIVLISLAIHTQYEKERYDQNRLTARQAKEETLNKSNFVQ